ncbi:MAG: retroviral-like aspartic protease [Planctomycetes bacterium]|nr:retroviral-like aspartic protease [Planctomycetota bacterium]
MIKQENKQKGVNLFEPDFYFKPLVYINIINPESKKCEIVSATIDTGADNCYVSRKLVSYLGLQQSVEPPMETFTADGVMKVYAAEAEYGLADENKKVFDGFPIQKTHFYINESNTYHMVLGFRGFLDRFKEIKIRYPQYLEFWW